MFLSLALIKRCSELVSLGSLGQPAATGRDYRVRDLQVLIPIGVASGMSAVVVFGLFIAEAVGRDRFGSTWPLWCVGLGIIYWIGRLWVKTSRGEMDDDPIVFTLQDRGSRYLIVSMVGLTLLAFFMR